MPPRMPLWVWIEYEPVIPRWILLNLVALQHHAGDAFELRLLNRTNLANYLTLPPEFERIPYAVAASDFARIGLLAEHGGLYMDADFLVTHSLATIRAQMEQYDIVSYADGDGSEAKRQCAMGVASNFVVARPKTSLYAGGWDSLRMQLTRRCGGPTRYKICCYMHKNNTPVPCRVPWALTDKIIPPVFKSLEKKGTLPKMFCYEGADGFTPHGDGFKCTRMFHIHALRFHGHGSATAPSEPAHAISEEQSGCHNASISCARKVKGGTKGGAKGGGKGPQQLFLADDVRSLALADMSAEAWDEAHLLCSETLPARRGAGRGASTSVPHFWGRLAYHLFESIYGALYSSYERIETSDLVAASLYRHALRDVPPHLIPPPFASKQVVHVKSSAATARDTATRMASAQKVSLGAV